MVESQPSFNQIIEEGYPPEWLPLIVIASAMTLAMFVLDVWAFLKHKKYSTRFPIQFMCTIGILQVFPFFSFMSVVGMIIPRAKEVCIFFSEGLEALTFLFFLRLVLTYMGGKKATKATLKGNHMHLNVPPLCCLVCLPQAKFTRKFFIFCEFLIIFYAFYCLVVGFLELIIMIDVNGGFPSDEHATHVITGTFGAVYHFALLFLLFFAIYGLSGIYHSAEELLKHKEIVKKFLVYKIFTLLVKFQNVLFASLVHHKVINEEFNYNKMWSAGLRVHNIVSFAACVEAMIAFPLAVIFYSTDDYTVEDKSELELRDDTVKNMAAEKQPENILSNEV